MILSESEFVSKVAVVSKCIGIEIADAFDHYESGNEIDFEYLFVKNTKLKSVRNWNTDITKDFTGSSVVSTLAYDSDGDGKNDKTAITFSTLAYHKLKVGDVVTTSGFKGTGYNTEGRVSAVLSFTSFTITSTYPTVSGIPGTGTVTTYPDVNVGGNKGFNYIGSFAGIYDSLISLSAKAVAVDTGKEVSLTYTDTIKPSATITQASGGTFSGTVITFFGSNTFSAGDIVKVTGMSDPNFNITAPVSSASSSIFYLLYNNSLGALYSQNGLACHRLNYDSVVENLRGKLAANGYTCYVSTKSGITTTGYTATLSSGSKSVTLTAGTTNGLIVGQSITSAVGFGTFGANATISTIDSSTTFTVSVSHTNSGNVAFSISGGYNSTLIAESPVRQACYYNSYIPTLTSTTSTSPAAYMSYSIPSNLSTLGFYGGKCSKLASTFLEANALSPDQAEAMLNELNSSCNG